jgi:TolB protein
MRPALAIAALLATGCASLPQVDESAAPEVAYLAVVEGYWQAWVMRADGSDSRQVTRTPGDKTRVSWFPDRRSLLVNGADGRVRRISIADGAESVVPIEPPGTLDAVLSPDGKHIAFSMSLTGSVDDNDIWLAGVDGAVIEKLTRMQWLQHEPAWSPDGGAVFYLSGRGDQAHDVWRLGLEPRRNEQLTVDQLYHFDVAVAPDGTIAFSNNRNGNYDLWVQRPNQAATALMDDAALDARPTWSSDGRSLLFESSREGGLNIWRIDLESREMSRVTNHPDGARMPVWFTGGSSR